MLHTRCIITVKRFSPTLGRMTVVRQEDFGIPYQPNHSLAHDLPEVKAAVNRLWNKDTEVVVQFRDAG